MWPIDKLVEHRISSPIVRFDLYKYVGNEGMVPKTKNWNLNCKTDIYFYWKKLIQKKIEIETETLKQELDSSKKIYCLFTVGLANGPVHF